jgi:hypothetical protein
MSSQSLSSLAIYAICGALVLGTTGCSNPPPAVVLWTSGDQQVQQGSEKIDMTFWGAYRTNSNGTYHWGVYYTLKAEDRGFWSWGSVSQLYNFTYSVHYITPQGSQTHAGAINLDHQSSVIGQEIGGYDVATLADVPNFKNMSATGQRYGGSNGFSVTWHN